MSISACNDGWACRRKISAFAELGGVSGDRAGDITVSVRAEGCEPAQLRAGAFEAVQLDVLVP